VNLSKNIGFFVSFLQKKAMLCENNPKLATIEGKTDLRIMSRSPRAI
jgi:hypothetical protein